MKLWKILVGLRSLPLRLMLLWLMGYFALGLLPVSSLLALPAADSQAQFPPIAPDSLSVPTMARQVTVRILGDRGGGSGVLIERRGQAYTVLTNAHVVALAGGDRYTILTADGKSHSGVWLRVAGFENYDLALVQFTSVNAYPLATVGNPNTITVGEVVYAAGFPNWETINFNTLEDTRSLGIKAFKFTTGQIGMLPHKPLQQGYQIGYTNQIEQGMSGGPVFDRYGRLIGINGGLKYPPQGIVAFIFADGTMPTQALFEQMQTLSWAIPITAFQQWR